MPTALVTGASSGIGAATSRRLVELGYTVYGGARRVDRIERELGPSGVRPLALDVTDDASMVEVVDRVIRDTGRLDVLVNNAGYGSLGALEDVPLDEARRQVEVNLFGLARLTQLALPHMRAQKSGTIVNVSSIGGKIYTPLGSWYHATKFAVEGMSDALRLEVEDFGIRVVIIEPGAIKTEWAGIAADNALAVSGSGSAYTPLVESVATLFDNPQLGSDPSVVADAIGRAVTARRPKARYAVGQQAWLAVTGRRLLTDRAMDAMVRANIRALARAGARVAAQPPAPAEA